MKKTKILKKERGITLIALVVTIVVLLILAGISINAVLGNNGLITRAKDAKEKTEQDQVNMEKGMNNLADEIDAILGNGGSGGSGTEDDINNNPIELGLEINPTEITLKKNDSEDVEGEEVLTQEITASVFGMETEPEITWEKTSDAIELSETKGKTITVTAVGTENAEATIIAKCTYDGKEYTAESKIKLEIIKPVITAQKVKSSISSYRGSKVNYGVYYYDQYNESTGEWIILSADEQHIYLIMDGYESKGPLDSEISEYNGTSDFIEDNGLANYPAVAQGLLYGIYDPNAAGTSEDPYLKYSSAYDNMKATQYLLDSTKWKRYANAYADWAIGAPTGEMVGLATSSLTEYGYDFKKWVQTAYVNNFAVLNRNFSYWLACPCSSSNKIGGCDGTYNYTEVYTIGGSYAFRPVVCLKSNVALVWDASASVYNLSFVE